MDHDRAVILDLDQTLLDSSALEPSRKARNWPAVYAGIGKLQCYDGIAELLTHLRGAGLCLGIVTSAPRPYCSKVIKACGLEVDASVCYHDTKRHKPYPDPLVLALQRLGDIEPINAVAVGDAVADILAARAAGIHSIAASWGCVGLAALKGAQPDRLVTDVSQLRAAIGDYFHIQDLCNSP